MTVTEATLCQLSDPPATVGAVGLVRSSSTAAPGSAMPAMAPVESAVGKIATSSIARSAFGAP